MNKIFLIIQEDGDIYCAADSHDLAAQIALEDNGKGDLKDGYFISKVNLFTRI